MSLYTPHALAIKTLVTIFFSVSVLSCYNKPHEILYSFVQKCEKFQEQALHLYGEVHGLKIKFLL